MIGHMNRRQRMVLIELIAAMIEEQTSSELGALTRRLDAESDFHKAFETAPDEDDHDHVKRA